MILPPTEKYNEKPLVTPRRTVRTIANGKDLRLKELRVPKTILLSLTVGATKSLIRCVKGKRVRWIYSARPLYVGVVDRDADVGVIWSAPGSPLVTMIMEDLIACGAEKFIGVGLTAAIEPSIGIGDIVIPSSAVRDEGTSHHYLPRNAQATSNWKIRDALIRCCARAGLKPRVGALWTTDAPYRETPSKVAYFQRRGVLGVDMESSAIFAVAVCRKVRAACILAASSTLTSGTPAMGMYSPLLTESVRRITQISVEAARELAA